MNEFIIQTIIGLLSGIFLGITGIIPIGLILVILDYFKIGDYISNLGAIMLLHIFPITIGSILEFYNSNKINYKLVFILLFSIIFGSYFSSKLVVKGDNKLSKKTIKYITSVLGFLIFISYLISGIYEKN